MRKYNLFFLSFLLAGIANAQHIDSIKFFTEDALIKAEITTDLKGLQSQKGTPVFIPGTIKMEFPDNSVITEEIRIAPRGFNRRQNCKVPPMKLDFRFDQKSQLASLGRLKLVLGCGTSSSDEELLLKEFVAYKIYNMLEEKSFRVRLMKVNYVDIKNRVRPFSQYSFVIEDDADLAKRTGTKKKSSHPSYLQEATDRNNMTKVAIFQYMIGNTDWAVPNNHNMALLFRKDNPAALPYAIPYDFDYSGLVDAGYAVPSEVIGTEKVTERVYRGFPRNMDEIQVVLDVFKNKKDAVLNYVRNFSLISERTRRDMVAYLDEFYETIESKKQVQSIFIDNARTK